MDFIKKKNSDIDPDQQVPGIEAETQPNRGKFKSNRRGKKKKEISMEESSLFR